MAVASNSPTQKKRYTVTALVFITLFLFTIFLFSKRALEPSLSLYKNPFPQIPSSSSSSSLPNSNLSLPNSTSTERVAVDPPSSSGSNYQLPLLHSISAQPLDPPTQQPVSSNSQTEEPTEFNDETEQDPGRENETPFGEMGETGCDLYLGTWVKDEHYPLYKPSSCPYVDEAFDCQSNGRSDSEYLKWRWKPEGCDLPRKNYYKEGDYLYPKFDASEAYRRALRTWASWIDRNVNPSKQLIFYRGYSSAHFRGGDWDSGGSCNGEKEPVLSGAILDNYPLKMKIVDEVIKEMRVPVKLLNVTRLTNFRKDGHPSIYGKNATAGKKVSTRKQDCSHWCLPGVPDAWNELIYATLVIQQTKSKSKNS
ncbi:hypothetical protein PRUPE_1G068600 [Prunus persica]|uniref:Trichome birefringence-like C-terminal domain-containing protein n=1 Tax=Prunus persica TaxID=3760 RepID=A0A251QTF7_PRUPE|nr:hypothetical protein PRUPE_1G068600 [Prunus persica]